MDLWDKDSNNLEDHVEHWSLLRREAALLTAARVSGVSRAGYTVVPALAACEAKARKAIEMHLLLTSLQESQFSQEPWTLAQTSAEMWSAEPRETFKKDGYTVEVIFGHEEENRMEYTVWGSVYVHGVDGAGWHKVSSVVNSVGVHYTVSGSTVTYVDFSEESDKYGGKGAWEVRRDGTVIHSHDPVTSSTDSCCQPILESADNDSSDTTTDSVHVGSRTPKEKSRGGRSRWPLTSTPATVSVACRETDTNNNSDCDDRRTWGRRGDCLCGGSPVIVLKGEPNQLKCLRYRLNRNHRPFFLDISSTWCWSSASRTTGAGGTRGRVTVIFESEEQREQFRSRVPVPRGVKCVLGYMPT